MITGAMTAAAWGAEAMISAFIPAYSQVLPQSADYVRILPEIVLSIFGIDRKSVV